MLALFFLLAMVSGCASAGPAGRATAVVTTTSPASTAAMPANPTAAPSSAPAAPSSPSTAMAADDGGAVMRALLEAINRGDQAAAEALIAPNATWERGGQCPPGQ